MLKILILLCREAKCMHVNDNPNKLIHFNYEANENLLYHYFFGSLNRNIQGNEYY